jgi:hypothetical protein
MSSSPSTVTYKAGSREVEAALRMIQSLTGRDGMGLGGFRIEVTVKAPSLHEATQAVRKTGFLDPRYWLGLGEGPHARHLLSAKVVDRAAFLDNANWVYQQAVSGKVFQGQAGDRPSKQQVQALTDILNALGWYGGIRSPTKSLAVSAWNMSPTAVPTLFNILSEIYQTDDQIRALFQLARANSTGDSLPCKAHPNNQHHRYQVNNGQPFRIACTAAITSCNGRPSSTG